MKLEINKELLQRAVKELSGVKRNRYYDEDNSVIVKVGEGLTLSFSTKELQKIITIDILEHYENPIDVVVLRVDRDELTAIISSIPKKVKSLFLSLNDDKSELLIKNELCTMSVFCEIVEKIDIVPEWHVDKSFPDKLFIPESKMLSLLERGSIAAATEGSQVHKSLCIHAKDSRVNFLGLDGKRLSKASCEASYKDDVEDKEILLSSGSVVELKKLFKDKNFSEKISCIVNSQEGHCWVERSTPFYTSILCMKEIDGKFPDYTRVIPEDNPNAFKISHDKLVDFQECIKTCKLLSKKQSTTYKIVEIYFSKQEIGVYKLNGERGHRGLQSFKADYIKEITSQQDRFVMSFNIEFIQDYLKKCGKNVELDFLCSTPNYPAVMRSEESEIEFLYIVMPIIFV